MDWVLAFNWVFQALVAGAQTKSHVCIFNLQGQGHILFPMVDYVDVHVKINILRDVMI